MDFKKNYLEYQKLYKSLSMIYADELKDVAPAYDKWFLGEFSEIVRTQCNFNGEKFAPTPPDIINRLVKLPVAKCNEIIFPPIANYMGEHFLEFYEIGLELSELNAKMDNRTINLELKEEDKISVQMLVSTELKVWQNHITKHFRQVERELTGAMQAGTTMDAFLVRMVCPDGHIFSYPYGNSRISWGEHIRRFLAGRPQMVASTATLRKLVVEE